MIRCFSFFLGGGFERGDQIPHQTKPIDFRVIHRSGRGKSEDYQWVHTPTSVNLLRQGVVSPAKPQHKPLARYTPHSLNAPQCAVGRYDRLTYRRPQRPRHPISSRTYTRGVLALAVCCVPSFLERGPNTSRPLKARCLRLYRGRCGPTPACARGSSIARLRYATSTGFARRKYSRISSVK